MTITAINRYTTLNISDKLDEGGGFGEGELVSACVGIGVGAGFGTIVGDGVGACISGRAGGRKGGPIGRGVGDSVGVGINSFWLRLDTSPNRYMNQPVWKVMVLIICPCGFTSIRTPPVLSKSQGLFWGN